MKKRRMHDGIVGAVILLSIALGHYAGHIFFWIPVIVASLMVVSAFTGFCPIYCILDKSCKSEDSCK